MKRGRKIWLFILAVIVAGAGTLFLTVPVARILPAACFLFFQSDPPILPVPVLGISPDRLADSFGAPRSGGRRHKGIDIFAGRGRAVLSTTRGVAMSVGEDRLGGNTVRVLGPGCKWHYYAHLDRYGNVKPGQWIQAGHLIGTVGDSGNAKGTPTHLHYGIYSLLGSPVNPYPLLKPGSKRG